MPRLLLIILAIALLLPLESSAGIRQTVEELSSYPSRASGSAGAVASANYIKKQFYQLGLTPQILSYQLPRRRVISSTITINGKISALPPLLYNAVSPGSSGGIIDGPLLYLASGKLAELDGLKIAGAIVLLDDNSADRWQKIASLGARAIIYLGDGDDSRFRLQEKEELSPLNIPCYWLSQERGEALLDLPRVSSGVLLDSCQLQTVIRWENVLSENIITLVPGSDPALSSEVVMVESFYDSREWIAGKSPGAGAALGIASLLEYAKKIAARPPPRSTLLVASSGSSQALAGFRETVWSISADGKSFKNDGKILAERFRKNKLMQDILDGKSSHSPQENRLLTQALSHSISSHIDQISRQLNSLRLRKGSEERIKSLAQKRLAYKKFSWRSSYAGLNEDEKLLLQQLLPESRAFFQNQHRQLLQQQQILQQQLQLRKLLAKHRIVASISLYLSGNGDGVGAFNRGWLYPLKASVRRTGIYSQLAEVLEGQTENYSGFYVDGLRSFPQRPWQSWFIDQPQLGGEVSSLAGMLGISLVTTNDARALWGTSRDLPHSINWKFAQKQNNFVHKLLTACATAPRLDTGKFPRNGLSQLDGRANLLLQGELFPSYPGEGTIILAYQGLSRYYSMVDSFGNFRIRGFGDKKNISNKLIIEGYRFKDDGTAIWAIDKRDTGKNNYRLKILRRSMQTDLTLFTCRQNTIFDLLEPRNLDYMTKIQLYDGRRDAAPQHYWYSRIDTKKSSLCSIFVEPNIPLKLTLSDSVLTAKMVLTNSSDKKINGRGYGADPTNITHTSYRAATDAWRLLAPRINNLQKHGIYDLQIDTLKKSGLQALAEAEKDYQNLQYSRAEAESATALALAARVYGEVEKTQKDVLFGVLFYIALFVPFAYVMERFLCNCSTIYSRICAFSAILLALIAIIYQVHPAFALAYSPLVIILAFFIIVLSALVSAIIFLRFEEEMIQLQNKANHYRPEEISQWKAFAAAFFLGISNLRRRPSRTVLSILSLVILSFTIMGFTTVKSGREQLRLPFAATAPYHGILLKKNGWRSLENDALSLLTNSETGDVHPAPRAWLENSPTSTAPTIPLSHEGNRVEAIGALGLSVNEAQVTDFSSLINSGQWFSSDDEHSVIISNSLAKKLGAKPLRQDKIMIWGVPFTLLATFDGEQINQLRDLDGEAITPAIFPEDLQRDLSDAEQDAVEAGEDISSIDGRIQHLDAKDIVIFPVGTLLAAGGTLKSVVLQPPGKDISNRARKLVDRFSLLIFAGDENGTWLYNATNTISYSGVSNLLIPLLLAILIILNTMISSVQERRNEIAVYTSVGLAPRHVAFLFIAEALAMAVVSVVIGYLLSQVSAYFLADTELWRGLTINYSSLAGVASMLLIICVVLLSVLYPARVASQIAIPDVRQNFSLPKNDGESFALTLPFLLKRGEAASLAGFLHSYFTAHRDVSHGIFSADDIGVTALASELGHSRISCRLWLAPFDLGIMQQTEISLLHNQNFIDQDFLEIEVRVVRQAGEASSWLRINTVFFHQMRKQLLIWRSLDPEGEREHANLYRQLLQKEEL